MHNDSVKTSRVATAGQNRQRGRAYILTVLGLLLSGGAITLGWNANSPKPTSPTTAIAKPAEPPTQAESPKPKTAPEAVNAPANRDEEYRRLAIGKWETNRSGRRVLMVNPDGTATMDVNVEGVWSYAVGNQVKLTFQWKIENEYVIFDATGGEPAASVEIITSYYGKHREQPIVHLDEKEFRLHDDEPTEPDHIYTRISETP